MNSVTTLPNSRQRCVAIALVLHGLIGSVWPSVATGNPLTALERLTAVKIALGQPWPKTQRLNSANDAVHQSHPLAQQIVSVEMNVRKHAGSDQQARVYQFNYQTASARMLVVSLSTQSVIRETTIQSVHLPLNDNESKAALASLAEDSQAIDLLRKEQIRRGQKPFEQLSELSVKASIFSPIDANHACAAQRCALLSLFDRGNTVFAMEPFINLQSGSLGWLNR